MLNSEFIKYGAVNLEDLAVIHLNGDFDSVLNLLQGQVTSDCTLIDKQLGQISALCNEKGFISVSYTHLRAHETREDLVCRLLLEKKKS